MLTKRQFIDGFVSELEVIRHLGTKVDAKMLEYRPTLKQRSTLELMNYLGHIFDSGTSVFIAGDVSLFATFGKEAPVVTLENFDLVMQMQIKSVVAKIEALTEEDLAREVDFYGIKASLAEHLLGASRWATAYKMQLFLYLKSCGHENLNTMNLWCGADPAPKE